MKMKSVVLAVVAGAILAGTANASFPVSTSFEAPEWNLGPAAGQNPGWGTFGGSWAITDEQARTGTQSLRWQNTGTWFNMPSFGVSGGTVTTTVWVYITEDTAATRRVGLQGWGSPALGSNPAITFRSDGQVWANTTSNTQVFTGVTLDNPTNRWIEVSLQLTLETGGAAIGTVDGHVINMFNLTGADPGLGTVEIYATGTGSGVIYFDDYSAVPAPAALALLGLAGLVGVRRRRS